MSDGHKRAIAKSTMHGVIEAMMADDVFWEIADAEIAARMTDADQAPARLYLTDGDGPAVYVDILGETVAVPVKVVAPSLPVSAGAEAQIEETEDQIASLRAFAAGLIDMADEAERSLAAITGGHAVSD